MPGSPARDNEGAHFDPRIRNKNLQSGMSASGMNAQTKRMQAIVNRKRVEDEQAQLKARIVKLKKEKERAQKHINDMERQQKLMTEMHNEKNQRRSIVNNLRAE